MKDHSQSKQVILSFLLQEKKITVEQAYHLVNNSFFIQLKIDLVQKLLDENSITSEQSINLLKEEECIISNENILPPDQKEENFFEKCSCHPKNGGGGICGCIMGKFNTSIC